MYNLSILEILLYSSLIVWIFPVIRQYRGRTFFIFLVIALGDPITILLSILFNINLGPFSPLFTSFVLALVVLFSIKEPNNIIFYIIFYCVCLFLPLLSVNYKYYYFSMIVLHVFIFYQILIFFIKNNISEKSINIFYIIFLLYELLNIFKVSNLVIGVTNAYEYHALTSIFQVALGLYFSIFRENSPRNFIKL